MRPISARMYANRSIALMLAHHRPSQKNHLIQIGPVQFCARCSGQALGVLCGGMVGLTIPMAPLWIMLVLALVPGINEGHWLWTTVSHRAATAFSRGLVGATWGGAIGLWLASGTSIALGVVVLVVHFVLVSLCIWRWRRAIAPQAQSLERYALRVLRSR